MLTIEEIELNQALEAHFSSGTSSAAERRTDIDAYPTLSREELGDMVAAVKLMNGVSPEDDVDDYYLRTAGERTHYAHFDVVENKVVRDSACPIDSMFAEGPQNKVHQSQVQASVQQGGEDLQAEGWDNIAVCDFAFNSGPSMREREELYDEDGFLIDAEQAPTTSRLQCPYEAYMSRLSHGSSAIEDDVRSYLQTPRAWYGHSDNARESSATSSLEPEPITTASMQYTVRDRPHRVNDDGARMSSTWLSASNNPINTGEMTPLELYQYMKHEECEPEDLQVPEIRDRFLEYQGRMQRIKMLQEATEHAEQIARQRQGFVFSWNPAIVEQTAQRAKRGWAARNRRRYWLERKGINVGISGSIVALHEVVVKRENWVTRRQAQILREERPCVNPKASQQRYPAFEPPAGRGVRPKHFDGEQRKSFEKQNAAPTMFGTGDLRGSYEQQNDPQQDAAVYRPETLPASFPSVCSYTHVQRAAVGNFSFEFESKESPAAVEKGDDRSSGGNGGLKREDTGAVGCWPFKRRHVRPPPDITAGGIGIEISEKPPVSVETPAGEGKSGGKRMLWSWKPKAERQKLLKRYPPNALPARFIID